MANVILDKENSLVKGYAGAVDMTIGGQQGAMTDPANWMYNDNYTKQRLIPVLYAPPGAMKYMPDGQYRIKMLKALIELHAISITGINTSHTAEFAETIVNNNEMMETYTRVQRQRSVPVFSWPEKSGKPVYKYWRDYLIMLGMDPETGHPGIIKEEAYIAAGSPELTPAMRSFTVLFIEPAVNLNGVVDAVLISNMQPKGVNNEMASVKQQTLETVQHDVEFTGLTQVGEVPLRLGTEYLESLNKQGYAPLALAGMIEEIDASVSDESANLGWRVAVNANAERVGQ